MRRLATIGLMVGGLSAVFFGAPRKIRLYAQTVPFTAHASWNPNATAEAVQFYTVSLDGGAGVQVPASTCSASTCSAAVVVPTFGAHAVAVTATNFLLSTDPNSPQTGPASSVAFTLAQAPKAPAGATVGR